MKLIIRKKIQIIDLELHFSIVFEKNIFVERGVICTRKDRNAQVREPRQCILVRIVRVFSMAIMTSGYRAAYYKCIGLT